MLKKVTDWYFSRKALPHWGVYFLDSLIVAFSVLAAHFIDEGATFMIQQHCPILWGLLITVVLFGFGFRASYVFGHRALFVVRGFAAGGGCYVHRFSFDADCIAAAGGCAAGAAAQSARGIGSLRHLYLPDVGGTGIREASVR